MHKIKLFMAMVVVAVGVLLTGCGNSAQQIADDFPCSQSMKTSTTAGLDLIVESTFPRWYVSNSRSFFGESYDFKKEWRRQIVIRSGVSEPIVVDTELKVPARCSKSDEAKAKLN
ncbi:hypothetical protein LBMAG34_2460 [Candidatus Saccharibacteria bacterium]|nr:hypothetical protein LBMAG34_2460 [Candidatus Saccharibacteria bacterium]